MQRRYEAVMMSEFGVHGVASRGAAAGSRQGGRQRWQMPQPCRRRSPVTQSRFNC